MPTILEASFNWERGAEVRLFLFWNLRFFVIGDGTISTGNITRIIYHLLQIVVPQVLNSPIQINSTFMFLLSGAWELQCPSRPQVNEMLCILLQGGATSCFNVLVFLISCVHWIWFNDSSILSLGVMRTTVFFPKKGRTQLYYSGNLVDWKCVIY
jgi:hypothetical protein